MLFTAEILGYLPQGYTVDDVFASVDSAMREQTRVKQSNARNVGRTGLVSVRLVFEAAHPDNAKDILSYAKVAPVGFVSDVSNLRVLK